MVSIVWKCLTFLRYNVIALTYVISCYSHEYGLIFTYFNGSHDKNIGLPLQPTHHNNKASICAYNIPLLEIYQLAVPHTP